MTGIINLIIRQITRIISKNNNIKYTNHISRTWYGTNNAIVTEEQIMALLKNKFPKATDIKVEDVSEGCGAMFEIYVEAPEFKGLSLVKQHKSVYEALKGEIKQIHGVYLTTKAP